MSARILDGAATAKALRAELAREVIAYEAKHGAVPGLAVVLVGEDPASQVYVRNKSRAAEEVGMKSWTHRLPADTTQALLLDTVERLNRDPSVHGILVQLPLPKAIDPQAVIAAIDPAKDVDGFHPVNAGKLALGLMPCLVPCTPQGCMILLRQGVGGGSLAGRKAIVLGRSNIVGKPIAQLLLQADCTVTIAHSRTRDLAEECRAADIVVAAIGKPSFVKGDWIKPGAVVIDVGINRIDDAAHSGKTKLVGDVDFAGACEKASAITPVPGGVGPMTIACLLKNTLQAAQLRG
ncbi:MAG: bifunctional methylenetetrahydrofolate dehydrogenase/methenyltetrahydrofolate cyclohydrolase FolD [Bdellovibrionales bacterium]